MKRVMCVWLPHWPIQRLRAARGAAELDRSRLSARSSDTGDRRSFEHSTSATQNRGSRECLPHRAVVLYACGGRGKLLVTACSAGAARRGVASGMPLAEARALASHPSVHFEPHDPRADLEALHALAKECQQFSPWVAVDEAAASDCLILDITGCAHLFGGEAALAARVAEEFRRRGYVVRIAVADTLGAAWALVHAADDSAAGARSVPMRTTLLPPGAQAEALRPLPVETLRLSDPVVQRLHDFDLLRIGQLLDLPRADLVSRFGREASRRLDQALGDVAEVLTFEGYVEPLESSWQFEWPVADRRPLEAALEQLLTEMIARLRPRNLGVQKLRCALTMTLGAAVNIEVGLLQASAMLGHLMELVRLHLERAFLPALGRRQKLDMQEGAEIAGLTVAVAAVPLEFRQGQLWDGVPILSEVAAAGSESCPTDRWREFPVLIERLCGRLGEQAVLRPLLWPDPQPERACRYESWLVSGMRSADRKPTPRRRKHVPGGHRPQPAPPTLPLSPRPSALVARPAALPVMSLVPDGPPLSFPWQGRSHQVAHCWGPERIETGWWRDQDVRRDYYRVETTDGQRFWLFRQRGDRAWFLHGCFA